MRISIVISTLRSGGAERVVSMLANGLAGRNHSITLHTFADPEERPFYQLDECVSIRNLGGLGSSGNILSAIVANGRRKNLLSKSLRTSEPDVIASFMTSNNVLTLLSRPSGVPAIVSERLVPWAYPEPLLWKRLRATTYNKADAIVSQSNRVLDWAQAQWRSPIHRVIPNPVCRPTAPKAERSETILAVGRLSSEKGHERLIRCFRELAGSFPSWHLRIVGDGPLKSELQILANNLGLASRVEFVGRVGDPGPEYRRAAIFALPSHSEGFPNALLEAMAHGCACVSFDCPVGPSEIIEGGINGLLAANDSLSQFSSALGRLMATPDLRERLASEAERIVERFSVPHVCSEWEQLFEELVSRREGKMKGPPSR